MNQEIKTNEREFQGSGSSRKSSVSFLSWLLWMNSASNSVLKTILFFIKLFIKPVMMLVCSAIWLKFESPISVLLFYFLIISFCLFVFYI